MRSVSRLIICLILFLSSLEGASLNLVVFSYNRPLQLYAFLKSFEYNSTGCERISVIYKADSAAYKSGYEIVKQAFPYVEFLKQSSGKKFDFKPLTLKAIGFGREEYVIFAVDDIIVTRPIHFDEITEILTHTQSHGFYLRLGEHITECYSENKVTGTPPCKEIIPSVLSWRFKDAAGDWAYPHTVDMTIYRKHDIKSSLLQLPFTNPNTLEGNWAYLKPQSPYGACFKEACVVNCPLNKVQTVYNNRCSNECSPEELLEIFLDGYEIDILPLQNISNKAPHMDYKPTFILR